MKSTVGILQACASQPFLELVTLVIAKTGVDEATAKASILRLNFEGRVEIGSDWSVRLVPAECQVETQVERQFVAA